VAGVKFQVHAGLQKVGANSVFMRSIDQIFCACTVLSLLDFLEQPTSLNEEPAASEAAMVESSVEVIDLRDHT